MKILLRLIKYLFLGVLVVIIAGLTAMYIIDPVVTSRLLTVPFGAKSGPLERVSGGPLIDIPTGSAGQISAAALAKAIAYGEETGSHALIVYHDGAIQLEHYYPGHDAEEITPTQSMHKSVLAMLVGIAIKDGYIKSEDDYAYLYLPEWANDERASCALCHPEAPRTLHWSRMRRLHFKSNTAGKSELLTLPAASSSPSSPRSVMFFGSSISVIVSNTSLPMPDLSLSTAFRSRERS